MKINTTDPDLRTIFSRIDEGSLDLQPDFQRAEVWKSPKKKLLIDTILRGWQVPPVHVIFNEETYIQEVLDGQQRLSAVRDFMQNKFKVDGNIEPLDDDLICLDGLSYAQLPVKVKNRFDRYAIRVFEIYEYNQGEPGELFNRLNESLRLTSAEKRNAYVGELRRQIKSLVTYLDECGLDKSFLGFSNQRMAYHDMFIKLCYMLECKSLIASYTEKQLNDRARDDIRFNQSIIDTVKSTITVLKSIKEDLLNCGIEVHITKATLISWLYFISEQHSISDNKEKTKIKMVEKFIKFESIRSIFKEHNEISNKIKFNNREAVKELLTIFNIRSVSRVMTVQSLLIRDFIISIFACSENIDINFSSSIKFKFIGKITRGLISTEYLDVNSILDEYCDEMQGFVS